MTRTRVVETCEGCWYKDMWERPVKVLASGMVAYVVGGDDAGGVDTYIVTTEVPNLLESDGITPKAQPPAEPITISALECQPLCIDCHEPLYMAENIGPGACINPTCFLYWPDEATQYPEED